MTENLRPETTYSAIVGRVLAMQRQKCQLEQANLASALGITQSTWSRIESGESALTVEQLGLAAGALGTSPAEILRSVDHAVAGLRQRGVNVQHGSPREFAKQGLALVGAVALGALIIAILARE